MLKIKSKDCNDAENKFAEIKRVGKRLYWFTPKCNGYFQSSVTPTEILFRIFNPDPPVQ